MRSISDAVVAKDGEPFFLCPPDGQVPCAPGHGYGLYHDDCRFLDGYELRIAGVAPSPLGAGEVGGTQLILELTNPEIRDLEGRIVPKEQLGISWVRAVDGATPALDDEIQLRNYGRTPVSLRVTLRFEARFEDVFEVRGLATTRTGSRREPRWSDGQLEFGYDGADGIDRSLRLTFDPPPDEMRDREAGFDVHLGPRGRGSIRSTIRIGEAVEPGVEPIERRASPAAPVEREAPRAARGRDGHWLFGSSGNAKVRTSSLALEAALARSFSDLRLLEARLDGFRYYEAGIPWFATLFGRDSLITAIQTLPYNPSIAADTLRLLARRRGRSTDRWRDEEPGKILHELRIGELARIGEVPHNPYFGTVDATPLFLILLAAHASWTGSLAIHEELRDAIDEALRWLDAKMEADRQGFVSYESDTRKGLINQGWKDSGDAMVTAEGAIAEPPVAVVEVQAYAYRAWLDVASLLERAGDGERAGRLRAQARDLQGRFEDRFWSDELGCYVLALADGRPLEVVASNGGHALWAGIAGADRAQRTSERLMRPDVFNGWGIRTLSADAAAYRPLGYHLGTVWPHDNAIIAAGFRRYGLDDAADAVLSSLVEATQHFPHARLPECFAGYDRDRWEIPIRYPVACHPQAWAAGSIPYLLASSLGLVPEAFEHRLRVVRPRLPKFVETVELAELAVGDARAHLRFERHDGGTTATIVGVEGELDVVVEDGSGGSPS